jgi:hypothetical protein
MASFICASVALGLPRPVFASGGPGGQFPQRPTSPSTLPGSARGAMGQPSIASPNIGPTSTIGPPLSRKQKDALVNDNYKKTKADVARLSKLVRSLQQAIDKSNANVLSLSIVKQASKVAKLAKRIRKEAKGY